MSLLISGAWGERGRASQGGVGGGRGRNAICTAKQCSDDIHYPAITLDAVYVERCFPGHEPCLFICSYSRIVSSVSVGERRGYQAADQSSVVLSPRAFPTVKCRYKG